MNTLDLALLYLLTAVLGVVIFRSFKLPAILAYLTVGVIIGPNALALAGNSKSVAYLAEFGVVFLMFAIGLEFSLPKLRRNLSFVFALGGGQVFGMMLLLTSLSMLFAWLAPKWWGMDWRTALALSGAMAMSSTAVVAKMMSERQELESEHGKRVFGVLLFQDLAVVPLLILIPALNSPPETLAWGLFLAVLKATALVTLLLVGGRWVMRHWLRIVARRKSDELFMLNLLLITLGLAWLTEHFGLSLALGAFVAGMLISETEFVHRVEAEIKPFHDVLLGLFFISIGMLLDWELVVARWPLVLLLWLVPCGFKFAWVWYLAKRQGAPAGVSLRTGLYLAQMGEFGIVLLQLASKNQVMPPHLFNPILAAMVLSMLATPFIIQYSNTLVLKLSANEWLLQSLQMTSIARKSIDADKHVIICGFGRSGQNMAKILSKEGIAYIALDTDADRVRQASAAGDAVVYGDSTRLQSLMAAGLARATTVAITFIGKTASLKVLDNIKTHAPHVAVVVRTLDDYNLEQFQQAGATEIVPEAVEGSLMLTGHVLALQGMPMRRVIRVVQEQRDARYALLRGYFHGEEDSTHEKLDEVHLQSIILNEDAQAIGQSLASLGLATTGVQIVSVRRKNGEVISAPAETNVLANGDTIVVSGTPEALVLLEESLQKPHS